MEKIIYGTDKDTFNSMKQKFNSQDVEMCPMER
jgi:hypothetical protein